MNNRQVALLAALLLAVARALCKDRAYPLIHEIMGYANQFNEWLEKL